MYRVKSAGRKFTSPKRHLWIVGVEGYQQTILIIHDLVALSNNKKYYSKNIFSNGLTLLKTQISPLTVGLGTP